MVEYDKLLEGRDAIDFVKSSLEHTSSTSDGWTQFYDEPGTGCKWVKDYPNGGHHGGGIVRLRRIAAAN